MYWLVGYYSFCVFFFKREITEEKKCIHNIPKYFFKKAAFNSIMYNIVKLFTHVKMNTVKPALVTTSIKQ